MRLYYCPLFLLICSALACKKDGLKKDIFLYDQPLEVVQRYAIGTFNLLYRKGGLGSVDSFKNNVISISSDRISWRDPDSVYVESPLIWLKGTDARNHSCYYLEFKDKSSYPVHWAVESVENGLLVLVEGSADSMGYYLERH